MSLQVFRNFGASKGWVVLVGVLVAAFVVWDISGYLGVRPGAAAITVNGEAVPLREIDATYRNRVATITKMMGGTAPTPEMLEQLNVPQLVLTEVLHRNILNQAAHGMRLQPATSQLREAVTSAEMFQRNGSFDTALYKQVLGQQGLTPAAYESMLRDELALQQLARLVQVAAPAPAALMPLLQLEEARYTLDVATLPATLLAGKQTAPDAAALKAFYDANASAYTVPEKRSFEVLAIRSAEIGRNLTIPEADVAAYYEANRATYSTPEQRNVRHILLADAKQAVDVYNRLKAGADFATLATELSGDPGSKSNGGSLGLIAKNDVVEAFADKAFALPLGEIGEPVQTSFGWHIIRVDDIQPARAKPLADVRAEVEAALRQDNALQAVEDLLRTVDDKAAGGSTLAEIAKGVGLTLQPYALVPATTTTVDAALLQAAFTAEQGSVEGPVTLDNGDMAYLQVNHIQPQAVPPLAGVQARVENDYRQAQQQRQLEQLAGQLVKAAEASVGNSLANVAAKQNLAATTETLTIAGVADAPEWLHSNLLKVMALPAGGVLAATPQQGDARMVVRLAARTTTPLDESTAKAAVASYRQQIQQDVEQLLIQHLVAEADVSYNAPLLRQVFGANWNPPQ